MSTEMEPRHAHHRHYQEGLKNFDERLSASILGFGPQPLSPHPLPSIRQRFEPYLGWLKATEVQTLRYEDLLHEQERSLGCILDHAGQRGFEARCDRSEAIEKLSQSIAPQRSPTFRSGKSGGWSAVFTEIHKQQFKQIAGDLLIQLGYEENNDW